MAQIIKHRRGSIGSVKNVTARNAELLVASGSINDLNGPFVFIGSPTTTDEGVAGAYRAVSKIYQGTNVPVINAGTYGSTLDGTPFYSTNDQTLYILNNDGAGGNVNMDLTGNLEGRSVNVLAISSISGSTTITGSLSVSSDISSSGNITASNLSLSGDANISGNINLGGNIFIGNQTSDLVVFGGEVSSSINPTIDNAFDLGTPILNWKDLHISGTAYIDTAKIRDISLDGVMIFNDLAVSGSSYLGNEGSDSVYVTGSLNVSGSTNLSGAVHIEGQTTITSLNVTDLTDNRILLAGVNGEIEDDTNLTFNGIEFNIGQGNFTIQSNNGNTYIDGKLTAVESASFHSRLEVTGSTLLKDTLDVVSTASLHSTLEVTGSTLLGNILDVVGVTTLHDDLIVSGTTNLVGITTIESDANATDHQNAALVVSGGVGIGRDLYVSGSTTIVGNLTVLGSQTTVNISSSTINLDDNVIRLNAFAPFERYAGIEVMDSGSNNLTASLTWDSLEDYWLIESASGQTGKIISTTFGNKGSETSLTLDTIPKATGLNAIGDSYLKDDGFNLSYFTDALVVTGSTGQTYIKGKVTLPNAGGMDIAANSSAIVFRNTFNELGYVGTSDTLSEMTGIMGYRTIDGALVFSSLIDGGGF